MNNYTNDVIIIGGGLAGLTAANYLARAGRQVTLLEKARHLGGRAMTQEQAGFSFNLGPHALYLAGEGAAILKELQIPFSDNKPLQSGNFALHNNQLVPLPFTPVDFLRTQLFGLKDKVKIGRILGGLVKMTLESAEKLSLQEWVTKKSDSPMIRQYLFALARLSTYANAPEQFNAAVFVQQFQRVVKENVCYLDNGWQTVVDGLRIAAEQAKVTILTGKRATAVSSHATHPEIHLADGEVLTGTAVILAVDPKTAAQLLPKNEQLAKDVETAVSVRAACLTIGLRHLPNPDCKFVLGLDQPLYLSVHSATAQLAPDNQALIHIAKYLPVSDTDPAQDMLELEGLLDLAQSGWRNELVTRQFLPKMTVVNRLVTKADGGLNGRLPITLPHSVNIFLAGDWVGAEGWLADASFASGRTAAQHILQTSPIEINA